MVHVQDYKINVVTAASHVACTCLGIHVLMNRCALLLDITFLLFAILCMYQMTIQARQHLHVSSHTTPNSTSKQKGNLSRLLHNEVPIRMGERNNLTENFENDSLSDSFSEPQTSDTLCIEAQRKFTKTSAPSSSLRQSTLDSLYEFGETSRHEPAGRKELDNVELKETSRSLLPFDLSGQEPAFCTQEQVDKCSLGILADDEMGYDNEPMEKSTNSETQAELSCVICFYCH